MRHIESLQYKSPRRRHLPALIAFAMALCVALPAWAEEVYRTVVLNVRDAQTKLLLDEIAAIPSVDIREQPWFLGQVKERGMKATKLLSRPADLRFVMSGGDIDYVVHVDLERGEYEGRVYGPDGELIESVPLGREFGQVEAAEVRAMFERILGIDADEVVPAAEAVEQPTQENPAVAVTAAESEMRSSDADDGGPTGFTLGVAARVFKRDHTFAGANNAVLNFVSAFYPGFDVEGAFVLDSVRIGPGALGFRLGLSGGFDSLATSSGDASIFHLDGRGAVILAFGEMQLGIGGRHVRYSISENSDFPTLAYTVVTVGLAAEKRIERLVLVGDVEAHPWGLFGGSTSRLFGESSTVIGFAAGLRAGYAISDAFVLRGGYGFRLERSAFPGAGELDFADTRGFELVHGPELGISWQL